MRADYGGVEARRFENRIIRLKVNDRAVAAKCADLLDFRCRLALRKRLANLVTVPVDRRNELFRERVDDRGANAVQAAGMKIRVGVAELAAGVQRAEDQF